MLQTNIITPIIKIVDGALSISLSYLKKNELSPNIKGKSMAAMPPRNNATCLNDVTDSITKRYLFNCNSRSFI